jgi:hypothetical protein
MSAVHCRLPETNDTARIRVGNDHMPPNSAPIRFRGFLAPKHKAGEMLALAYVHDVPA